MSMKIDSIVTHRSLHSVSEEKVHVYNKILLITNADFLYRRASDNTVLPELSDKVLDQLEKKFDQTIVLVINDTNESKCIAFNSQTRPTILLCEINRSDVFTSMRSLVLLLKQRFEIDVHLHQIGVNHVNTARRLSWLNIGEYIKDDRVRVVDSNDYDKAGIVVDKNLSFNDLAQIRSKKSWI